MKMINYLKGDATNPEISGNKIIAHICNDAGGWGKGFVVAVSKRWKEPELSYREWYKSGENFNLGEIQLVQTTSDIWIANMIGQHKINKSPHGIPPIRYEAVEKCLEKLAEEALSLNAVVCMPRIGCGLAGGKWEEIEKIINRTLIHRQVDVYVYDFE
ncbi:macro domain-containing protein [Elizabethkingia anophelis]|uniref:Appr-1-p processing protein n=2 Tax=Elizabethkingia anophelis TaxID=1117645 RepID=A0ABM6MUC0_9FLAO|nr:Appr-1-p processing protein [Elizabethkingia anophelis R26]ATC40443.1 Appr-1-p processing protein [Elizabethkingia anophelis Ag1]ATC44121.1 Appr-1-p processing protein [Elizabethkingia anophelis]ATC47797.1 Appr-1-p processing protein [Elizabethkingia anophelis]ELR79726.1 appr-1-p processing domain-containing protein [Elizabethkingia anophelis R26]